ASAASPRCASAAARPRRWRWSCYKRHAGLLATRPNPVGAALAARFWIRTKSISAEAAPTQPRRPAYVLSTSHPLRPARPFGGDKPILFAVRLVQPCLHAPRVRHETARGLEQEGGGEQQRHRDYIQRVV